VPGAVHVRCRRAADFLPETQRPIRAGDWKVAPMPADLQDRRVEITGPGRSQDDHQRAQLGRQTCSWPTSRIRSAPTWANQIAARSTCATRARHHRFGARGQAYRLNPQKTATLMVRPRGWHLTSACAVDGQPIPARCSTSACTSSTTPRAALERGLTGPYFYLPKLESHLEARLWNDVFVMGPGRAWGCRAARSRPPC
jgi:malate synthase